MDDRVEKLLGLIVGGAVDIAFGVDDAVQTAQRVESTLLKGQQTVGWSVVHSGSDLEKG